MSLHLGELSGTLGMDIGPFDRALASAGDKLRKWGPAAAKVAGGAALAVGAAAGAAIVKGMNLEPARDKVAASLGATPDQAARYGKAAGAVYSANFGGSMEEATEAVGQVVSSIKGLRDASEADITAMTSKVYAFSDAFGIDLARSAQVAGQMVTSGLAGSAEEGLDMLTATLQRVPAAVREDVLDAADEYGPFFAQLGLSGDQAMGMLAKGAEQGMYGIDKLGDSLKEFTIRATDGSKASTDAYKLIGLNADDMASAVLAGGDKAADATQQIVAGLQGIDDPVAQANSAIALFGTPLEDLGTGEIPAFLDALGAGKEGLGEFGGATQKMADEMGNNAAANLESFRRQIEVGVVEFLGAKALPALNDLTGYLSRELGPTVRDAAGWVRDDLAPALRGMADWMQRNEQPIKAVTAVITTLLLPALVGTAINAARSAAAQVAAWALTSGASVKGAATQVAAHYRVLGGWIAAGARATASAAMQVGGWLAMGAAAATSAAAQVGANVRTAASFVAAKAAMVASVAASAALRGATLLGAAAQWALNAALSANPIGLIIIAVAALVAGLIWFFTKTELGQKIVKGAMAGIRVAIGWVVEKAQELWSWVKGAWPTIQSMLTLPVRTAWTIIKAAWSGIKTAFSAAVTWVGDVFKAGWAALQWVLVTPVQLAKDGLDKLWTNIKANIKAVWTWVSGTFKTLWDGIKKVFTDPIGSAKTAIATMLGKTGLGKVFTDAVSALGAIWDGLKDKLKAPISFMVNTVINGGFLEAYGKVRGFLPMLPEIPDIKVPGFQRGGVATVPGTFQPGRRDNVLAVDGGGRPVARVEPGEAITPRAATAQSYGLLEAIRTGRLTDRLAGLKDGGVVWPSITRRLSGNYAGHSGVDIAAAAGTPIFAPAAGRVTHAGFGRGYGLGIFIRALDGVETVLGHASRALVRAGQSVAAGQEVAKVGSTGRSSGPHIHVERALAAFGAVSNRASTLAWLQGAGSPPFAGVSTSGSGSGDGAGLFDVGAMIRKAFDGVTRGVSEKVGGGIMGDLVTALPKMIVDKLVKAGASLLGGSGDPGGSGVERWRSTVVQALSMAGVPTSPAYVEAWLRQIKSESGGNPSITQQVRDVNSGGNEAQGLVQVIPGTFAAYRHPNLPNDRTHPLANLYAGINYADARYGARMLSVIGHGHGYLGGTLGASRGFHELAEDGRPELVLGRTSRYFDGGERVLNARQTADLLGGGKGPTADELASAVAAALAGAEWRLDGMADRIRLETKREEQRQW